MLKGFYLTLLIGPSVPIPVPQEVIDALTTIEVQTPSGKRGGFKLTFALSKRSLLNTTLLPVGYFDPPMRVIIVVTVNGAPHVLMDGVITQHTVTPSNEPGQSTLTIIGEDLSRMMDIFEIPGIRYDGMSREVRALVIIAKYAVLGIVPMVIPSIAPDIPLPTEYTPGHRGTDLQYITSLADQVGYVFHIEPGPLPGVNVAYWGPAIRVGIPQPALTVNMDAHSNVDSLSFTFDGFAKSLYFVQVRDSHSGFSFPLPVPDVNPLSPPLGVKPPLPLGLKKIDGMAKYNPLQAVMTGIAIASQHANVISGTGTLDVLRYGHVLQARQLVGVRGAGITYDGLYYVESVTHTIKLGEYKQNFTLSRNASIPFSQEVSV